MKSPILKRSVIVAGHKTSVSLENEFWNTLKEVAEARNITLSDLVSDVDGTRDTGNLSSALRIFVLAHYRNSVS
jgi:predicted DNA-binding ribbon-helix-helix protein